MRLSLLLTVVTILNTYANVFSQNAKINVNVENISIKDLLKEVESKSGYAFFFNDNHMELNKQISFETDAIDVEDLLKKVLKDTHLGYKILEDKLIVIVKNSNTQDIIVKGKVTDIEGNPLPGVNVLEKGTMNGSITNTDGEYSISVSVPDAILNFSYVGFLSEEIEVAGKTSIDVTMIEDIKVLEEVVVVGYGTQKKVNLTGAISTVDGKQLSKRKVAQTSSALQGISPGVVVTQRNGQPGADNGTISIRGKTTLNNNNALVLVDGVEMSIDNIEPSLIESISILKDAASSAIYGSRAANGVILVTTKRGQKNKISVEYNTYVGRQVPTNLPNVVNAIDHMELTNEAYINVGRSQLYSDEYIEEYKANMYSNPDKYPNTDWYDLVLAGNGFMQNHSLTMTGGTEKARVMASLGYLDQNGIIPNTYFKRYTLRINSDFEFNKSLSAQIDAHIKQANTTVPSRGTGTAIHWAGRIPATQAAMLTTGQWGEGWNGDNPVAFSRDGGLSQTKTPSVTLNLIMKYKPKDWFYVDIAYSPNYWQSNNEDFDKSIQTYAWDGSESYSSPEKTTLNVTHNTYLQNNLRSTINVEKSFNSHYFKLLTGYQQEDYRYDYLNGYREGYTFIDYTQLNAGSEENQKTYGTASEWALQSFFGRINYSFEDRYLFEANYRYDGSSRFSEGNKWGGFPSFSAGWRISEENFFSSFKHLVSNLKIRASWGQLGNQNIGTYPSTSTIELGTSYVFDGTVADGAALTEMANTEISWETTTLTNIGLDLTLFGKLNLVGEYYYKRTEDILLELDIPLIIGMSAPYQNAGEVENKGWDLGINYFDQKGDFKYDIGFNLSDVKNKVLDLKGVSETGTTVNREGHEMYSIYGLVADGYISPDDYDSEGNYLFAEQYGNFAAGDIKYVDQNGDNVIDANDYKVIGGTIPRFTYGLTFNASYKNFDVSTLLQGVGKANGLLYGQGIMTFYTGGTVQEQHKDHWTLDNQDAKFPRLAFNETNNEKISSFWMKNAAYMRVKNFQLGYTIPKFINPKAKIENLRIYLSGQNLFTIDNFWKGYDVEAPVGNGGYYPQVKTFMLGLDVKF